MESIEEVIKKTKNPQYMTANSNVSRIFPNLIDDDPDYFHNHFSENKIIEIGPGFSPVADTLLGIGIKEYVAVERFYTDFTQKNLPSDNKVRLVETDGLSYLLGQPDESAIVISFGFLDNALFDLDAPDYPIHLGKEIYRVTPKNSITIHGVILTERNERNYLLQYGFKPSEKVSFIWDK